MDLSQALNWNGHNYENIDQKKNQLNSNFSDRIFDINPSSLKYVTGNVSFGYPDNQKQQFISVEPHQSKTSLTTQSMQQAYPVSAQQKSSMMDNSMSPSYLQMKHFQELQNSMANTSFNLSAIEKLKHEQAQSLQQSLSQHQTNTPGLSGIDPLNNQQYAQTPGLDHSTGKKPCAYNAQGEAVSDSSTLYQDQYNRYRLLKEMSPEMLNQLYGRQIAQSVMPNSSQTAQGDIYEQTSCKNAPQYNMQKTQELKALLEKRKTEILKQKFGSGIQSYDNSNYGTTLNEAFISNL